MGVIASLKKRFLIENRGAVLRRSANLRLLEITLLLIVLDLAATLLPYLSDVLPIDSRVLLGLATLSGSLAWAARFYFQPTLSNPPKKEPTDGADQ